MRLLVCGGRDYRDWKTLAHWMNQCVGTSASASDVLVIHGGAPGADTLAGELAERAGVTVNVYPAKWSLHGRTAGPLRNRQMLFQGKPDVVLAAPGGRGTADMVRRARRAGVPVVEIPR